MQTDSSISTIEICDLKTKNKLKNLFCYENYF